MVLVPLAIGHPGGLCVPFRSIDGKECPETLGFQLSQSFTKPFEASGTGFLDNPCYE
jgi:hypothetical protein